MIAVIIGIVSGLVVILSIGMLKKRYKQLMYGLVLAGIGFLYVGFTWANAEALIVSAVQAIVFLFFAYYGIKKSMYLLAAGYFLHGTWDLLYNLFPFQNSIPPHYDLFRLSLDFTMGVIWWDGIIGRLLINLQPGNIEYVPAFLKAEHRP